MGKRDGSYFKAGDYLKQGDYMVSNNGFFHVILQDDGNLCVYRGSGPSDNRGHLWNANSTTKYSVVATWWENPTFFSFDHVFGVAYGTKPGDLQRVRGTWSNMAAKWHTGFLNARNFYAIIQDDGNFCIYEGDGPHDNPRGLWCANSTDEVVRFEVSSVNYDLDHATIEEEQNREIINQEVSNHTDVEQTQTVSRTETIEETSAWENKMGFKVGAEAMVKTGIPFIASGKVKVSVELSGEFAWSGSTKKGKDYKLDTPVVVPPRTTIIATGTVTVSSISVPYTQIGEYVYKSGNRKPGERTGTYTGVTSHNYKTAFFKVAKNGALEQISAEKIGARLN